jgi:hypothetical protein
MVPDIARSLEVEGYALLDLSEDPRVLALCDQAAHETQAYGEAGFNRVQDAWRSAPAERALAGLPVVTGALRKAYGAEPFPFQTLIFYRGSEQPAHADLIHFTADPVHLMCGVWLALEDVHPDAGPPFYYPGSHKAPVLSLADVGAPPGAQPEEAYRRYYEPALRERAAAYPCETPRAKKGQALVWAANLLHGGAPVRDRSRTRRSLVTHYFFDGSDYFTLMTSTGGRRTRRLPSDVRTGRFRWPAGGSPSLRVMASDSLRGCARGRFRFAVDRRRRAAESAATTIKYGG